MIVIIYTSLCLWHLLVFSNIQQYSKYYQTATRVRTEYSLNRPLADIMWLHSQFSSSRLEKLLWRHIISAIDLVRVKKDLSVGIISKSLEIKNILATSCSNASYVEIHCYITWIMYICELITHVCYQLYHLRQAFQIWNCLLNGMGCPDWLRCFKIKFSSNSGIVRLWLGPTVTIYSYSAFIFQVDVIQTT